ncbi:hypothetical protein [uncultured Demequina sp.]|uniref:hypothetical protein n=1 Tax=uncultured Demequina sp. TaxID=693499 RepID=UPI0025F63916|nr:hypothetical protein [uncultured Demequina sp.]
MIEIARTEAVSSVAPELFYERWADINTHTDWATTMEMTRLEEPFGVGARGWLQAKGGEVSPFVITEVVRGRVFADDTLLDRARLRIRHEAQPLHDPENPGGCRVIVTGLVDGPRCDEYATAIADAVQASIEENLASLKRQLEG